MILNATFNLSKFNSLYTIKNSFNGCVIILNIFLVFPLSKNKITSTFSEMSNRYIHVNFIDYC